MTLIIETSSDRAGIENLWERYSSSPDSTAFMALADQLRLRGCLGEAANICTQAKASHPQYVSCRVLLGRCLLELGLKDEAQKELEEVLELDRENAVSLRAMAELRLAQGNLSEAANYYRALVRINPADLDMQEKLAQVVKVLESKKEDTSARVGQEAAVTPSPLPEKREEAVHITPGIEAEVRMALEETLVPEDLLPVWYMKDVAVEMKPAEPKAEAAASPEITALARPTLPAERARLLEPAHPAETRHPSDLTYPPVAAQPARPAVRKPARTPVQFFDYGNRQSDFSLFAKWVEQERGGTRT